jgi:hypothetical protein
LEDVQQSDYPEQPVQGVTTHEIGNRTYVVAEVDPLDVDGTWTVAVGAGMFLVAFLALLPFYGSLEEAGRVWWVWSCLAGFGLGVVGWDYCRRRARQRQSASRR